MTDKSTREAAKRPLSPTSEVGSPSPQEHSDTSQNISVTLPMFNPDAPGADAAAWCKTVDMILSERPLEGGALVMALSKSLLGNSSQWLSQICFAEMSWLEFKDLLLHRYEGIEPPSAVLLNILNGRPSANESLSVYGSRLVTSLLTKWKGMSQEEIAVSLVLAHTSQIEPRLQSSVFTTNIKTRNELQQLLKAFAFNKVSDYSGLDQGPDRKKFKAQAQIKCHYCGKIGHKAFECRKKKEEERNVAKPNHHAGKPLAGRERSAVTCFKCGNPGHIASVCMKGTTSANNFNNEKRVDMCAVLEPTSIMKQMGESFIFFFDSGAECSLVKEKLCNKLAGKRIYNTRSGKTRCLPVIPRAFRWSVINHVHEAIMHLGWQKTLNKVYEQYWFEGKVQMELHPIPKVEIPWHTVHIDISGKLSGKNDLKEYIIVQIDAFTNPLELLIGKQARPLGMLPIISEPKIDCKEARAEAKENMDKNAKYDKSRVDQNKAKVVKHGIGDHVLLRSEERHQTKLDPKFKRPFVVTELLEGDRYLLKSLTSKRTYKYPHESLRKLPDNRVASELLKESDGVEIDAEDELRSVT
ncbi:uncharacterized protein [Drosophila takahashii]|uniref:uncharacterized protein n=1 Tax=Drosophila takahashii TaxID=29030 RepID=UPI0038991FDD